MSKRIFSLIFLMTFLSSLNLAQDDRTVGEVTVYADDPVYKSLRAASSAPDAFSGDYATVNNLVLNKDLAAFTLQNGEIYFLKSVEGRTTGAVFIGQGNFYLMPPNDIEKKSLAIFTESPDIKENFKKLVMFFTDDTFEQIKNSPNVKMAQNGSQASAARDAYRDKESLLKKTIHYNVASRTLADFYAPQRKGFFTTFIDGSKFGKLVFQTDPVGLSEVYPEQVELSSYGESDGGIWTAFHLADEYKKGTANSWTDRRSYDIKHHLIDLTIDGTDLIGKDELTLEMNESNARFLPFDFFGNLRVSSVKDESGNALLFVQEKKDEDSDFGVILPKAIEPHKPFKITVEYKGGGALVNSGSGNFILLHRSTWYPNNPATSFGDRAAFDLTFHYPKRYTLVGIGNRVSEMKGEKDTMISKWTTDGLDFAVAGFNYGDFKEKEVDDPDTGYKMEVYANNNLPDELKGIENSIIGTVNTTSGSSGVLTDAQNATRIYNLYFGKLPYKRIAMTQQPAGFFGQSWATLVYMPYVAYIDTTQRVRLLGIRGATNGFWTEVAPHEVAHQWWGHIVGWTSYHDQWMSEGFAEFSAALYIQFIEKDTGKYLDFWKRQHDLIVESSPATNGRKPYTVGPVTQGYRLNTGKTGSIARAMIYPKGAFILHMIRMMMYDSKKTGDQRFQAMMKDFIAAHYNQDVSTNDFKLAVEKYMTPAMDINKNKTMDWFFDEYVYGTDMPSYKFAYSVNESGGKTLLNGKITQSGVSDKFAMRVPVYVDYGKGWSLLGAATVFANGSVDLKDIPLSSNPKKVAIAVYQDILADKIENAKQ